MNYSRDRAEVRFEACFHSLLLFYFQVESTSACYERTNFSTHLSNTTFHTLDKYLLTDAVDTSQVCIRLLAENLGVVETATLASYKITVA